MRKVSPASVHISDLVLNKLFQFVIYQWNFLLACSISPTSQNLLTTSLTCKTCFSTSPSAPSGFRSSGKTFREGTVSSTMFVQHLGQEATNVNWQVYEIVYFILKKKKKKRWWWKIKRAETWPSEPSQFWRTGQGKVAYWVLNGRKLTVYITSNIYKKPREHFHIECHYALKLKVVLALPFKDPRENQLTEMH